MANYIVSYDLNGERPTHEEMDDHLGKIGAARGRILETVWYVGFAGTIRALQDHAKSILGSEDLLLVVEAKVATWTQLLVDTESLKASWQRNRKGTWPPGSVRHVQPGRFNLWICPPARDPCR